MYARDGIRAISLAVLVAACGGTPPAAGSLVPSPSVAPSVGASTTPEPTEPVDTARPTPGPSPTGAASTSYWAQNPPEPLLNGAAVRVLVSELNIRQAPSTSAKRVATFRVNDVILVGALPPVDADGYTWYHGTGPFGDDEGGLQPLPHDPYAGIDPSSGWFAAMKGSTPYVAKLAPRCPTAVDLRNLGAMLPAERLACFGDRTIEFEGTFRAGCPTCEFFGSFGPAWLANPNVFNFVVMTSTRLHGLGMNLRLPPGLVPPENGSIVRIWGHFDDPAATDCSISIVPWDYRDMELDPVPASVSRLWCRQLFVVERYEVVGTDDTYDPDNPFG